MFFAAGILDVDVVITCSGADDELERGEKVHDLRSDFFASDDDGFRIGVRFCEIRERGLHVLNDGEAFGCEDFGNYFVEFRRNKNFFH